MIGNGIYRLTQAFPADGRFGVTSQLRRAATSVPTNIAEGSRRQRPADFARFLNIAEGSLAEVEYLLLLSRDLGYVAGKQWKPSLARRARSSRCCMRCAGRWRTVAGRPELPTTDFELPTRGGAGPLQSNKTRGSHTNCGGRLWLRRRRDVMVVSGS
ncbi:MAG: four helix bundle protein [Planctomycetes bacterium]|nr:four helix bundle protein [Planctomycetota bacterium]